MPLFTYQCTECDNLMEKFQHDASEILKLVCPLCGCEECERAMPDVRCRVWLGAGKLLEEKILPDAKRIEEKISKGSDSDFLDIAGESG